ncbi:MAG: Velvet complex subunit ryp3 [Caeruleum heppii]|nr:MAG: Velvet complex subunit ryp3 [Caeruleum heppii]
MLPSIPQQPPPSTSTTEGGRTYSLDVVQQPVRARMCGFGDKDRRPITPPPCVRLIVRDAKTNKEVDINEIEQGYYVLTVDLWSADGTREVNLVRHSATSPSISTAVSSSYPPPNQSSPSYSYAPPQPQYQTSYNAPTPLSVPAPPPPHAHPQHPHAHPHPYAPQQPQPQQVPPPQGYYGQPPQQPGGPPMAPQGYYHPGPPQAPPSQAPAPSGMFTRNLIGSLSASAFRLTDPDNKMGVWFILQDLSVRTEGTFRLKMNFVNVGDSSSEKPNQSSTSGSGLNTGSAPVLASTFSDVFQVFSAKKFPGVIESTPLSKCFATQGIKIPIRKDGPKALNNREEYENDD